MGKMLQNIQLQKVQPCHDMDHTDTTSKRIENFIFYLNFIITLCKHNML